MKSYLKSICFASLVFSSTALAANGHCEFSYNGIDITVNEFCPAGFKCGNGPGLINTPGGSGDITPQATGCEGLEPFNYGVSEGPVTCDCIANPEY